MESRPHGRFPTFRQLHFLLRDFLGVRVPGRSFDFRLQCKIRFSNYSLDYFPRLFPCQ
jgi:hypothetical protein